MSRGQPDFGMYAAKTVTGSLSDMAELAVRLGSICTYDRRGEVIDLDDFNQAAKRWGTQVFTTSSYAVYSAVNAKAGSQSMQLHKAIGPLELCRLHKSLNVFASKRIGIEVSFSYPSTNDYFWIYLYYYDGALVHYGRLRIDFNAKEIAIQDDSDTLIKVIDTGLFLQHYWCFYTVKLVVDFETDKYVRVLFANQEYDASAIAFPTAEDTIAPTLWASYGILPRVSAATDLFVDNYILTQAEP